MRLTRRLDSPPPLDRSGPRPRRTFRLAAGFAAVCLVAVGLSAAGPSRAAVAAVTDKGSCVDGGRVPWISKVTWGTPYLAADGVTRVPVDSAGWTTTKTGTVPTDSVVRSYDGTGRLLQTLRRTARFDYGAGVRYAYRNPLNPPSAPGRAKVTVTTGVDGDGHGSCTLTYLQPANVTRAAGDPVVAAAGDIACADGTAATAGSCRHRAVSDKILTDTAVGTVLVLGDTQYRSGTLADFHGSFDPTWGRLKSRTRPVPGNHEYRTSGAEGYYDYFGSRAGDPGRGYYSFDLGTWHVVALNSEKDTTATGAQVSWLKADLKAHPGRCTLAFYHRPRWSSGVHGDSAVVAPFVRALYDANADLILNGHDHDYERLHPLNPSGVRDNARGITQIVSGLGGVETRPISPRSTTAAANASSFGYARLVLREGYADVSYRAAVGTYTDSTRVTCH